MAKPSGLARRSAFTLIELLVVISIIALLVGILLPALGAARKTAQGLVCQTHLKNLSTAFVAYGTDHQEWWPAWAKRGENDIRNRYMGSWIPSGNLRIATGATPTIDIADGSLFQYTPEKDVFVCPSDPWVERASGISYSISDHLYRKVWPDGRDGSSVEPAYQSKVGPTNNLTAMYPRTVQFRSPSNLIFLIDEGGTPDGVQAGGPTDERGVNDGFFQGIWSDQPGGTSGFVDVVRYYHNGSAAFGFADGHGELRSSGDEEIYSYKRGGYNPPGQGRRFEYSKIWDPAAQAPTIINQP